MGRKSKITQLPNELREALDKLVHDGRWTQQQITAHLNGLIALTPGVEPVSQSSVNRYAARMEEAGRRIRQAREVAKVWVGKLGEEPESEVGRLLIETLRTMAFDAATTAIEGNQAASPDLIGKLSMSIRDLERAAAFSAARELAVQKEMAKRAVQAVERAAKVVAQTGGQKMSPETLRRIREEIYGLVK
ncbi:MAG: DUF3486 family protein [Alphaproteobacteria bacterium]